MPDFVETTPDFAGSIIKHPLSRVFFESYFFSSVAGVVGVAGVVVALSSVFGVSMKFNFLSAVK